MLRFNIAYVCKKPPAKILHVLYCIVEPIPKIPKPRQSLVIAFLLDSFLIDQDIDLSISKFITGISDVDGDLTKASFMPLK